MEVASRRIIQELIVPRNCGQAFRQARLQPYSQSVTGQAGTTLFHGGGAYAGRPPRMYLDKAKNSTQRYPNLESRVITIMQSSPLCFPEPTPSQAKHL